MTAGCTTNAAYNIPIEDLNVKPRSYLVVSTVSKTNDNSPQLKLQIKDIAPYLHRVSFSKATTVF